MLFEDFIEIYKRDMASRLKKIPGKPKIISLIRRYYQYFSIKSFARFAPPMSFNGRMNCLLTEINRVKGLFQQLFKNSAQSAERYF